MPDTQSNSYLLNEEKKKKHPTRDEHPRRARKDRTGGSALSPGLWAWPASPPAPPLADLALPLPPPLSYRCDAGSRGPDWGCGGGGSELPAGPGPGPEGAEPADRGRGAESGARLAGEELGEGSEEERRAREGERGAGAAGRPPGRREAGIARARGPAEPPGRRGGRCPELGGGRGGDAAAAGGETRRCARKQDPGGRARGPHLRGPERVSSRSRVPPRVGAPGPWRLGVRRGGRPEGAGAGRGLHGLGPR